MPAEDRVRATETPVVGGRSPVHRVATMVVGATNDERFKAVLDDPGLEAASTPALV